MYKPSTYLVIAYFPTYLPTYETYFLQNWLLKQNQILTQLRFIHNWVLTGIQWMIHWWVLVHCGGLCSSFADLDKCGHIRACVIRIRPTVQQRPMKLLVVHTNCHNQLWLGEWGSGFSCCVLCIQQKAHTGKIRSRRTLQQR
jgi:hypothetical protein